MRFKKGSKVEVMNKKPPPSWHVAEIVSGNGDSYDGYQNKVFRRFIKPSLPTKRSLKTFQKEQQEEEDDYRSHKSHVIVSRNQKRVKHSSRQSQSQRYIIPNDSHKKVDAFVGNNSLNGCYYEMEKRKRTDDDDEESDSDECSVGSCSVVDIVSNHDDDDDDGDDGGGDDVAVSNDDIHRLELDAYRATLEALYASGPLSWEKEALLTNLRINLHISNDEHLIELRHLISSRVN